MFTKQLELLKKIKDINYFEQDSTLLFAKGCKSELKKQIMNVQPFNRDFVYEKLLYELIKISNEDEILSNRNLKSEPETSNLELQTSEVETQTENSKLENETPNPEAETKKKVQE